ncbi:AraC family transcriptional regulator, regulatory protein of adaptative response / methylphosphotriester-DNA alkyltransferase methyltransferase [Paenibacillus sp. UNCCL117]|uniref:bifunctional transcriptional activator/DNA repair enzyme AdaA n=1 Tax=unclassified Paenibacillus TaxID=185978 RepID=UPI0008907568|nr:MULTISPECIES: bifunctional transcriptional activator/DNA repair enzyme AdaA [unclassified Paenibacillus]SDD56758.1 AraC family transcriptional regulator, regulatory protein of adaptative response / methylphosphotriester-DNA alkyltransferase methyltransferase [Paenibacillus sp. cl123]SFW51319.1 AraC family transcriptional regulator, regulatory protein of adaptative response / methylphosphotriester-DNA alkyltransferase methyltransferase [Paenibacillus sp. UNCCL117]
MIITEERWRAILENNAAYDGQFFYAVRTTGIFCRPSCKSRPPRPDHISLFRTAEQAMSGGYRPCKRCKPVGQRLPDEEWIGALTAYIDTHYGEHLTLEGLADIAHGSPYHLHRTFRRILGVTPVAYIQSKRVERAKQYLIGSDKTVSAIGQLVGMPNTPYFITLFKKKTGRTPAGFREHHQKAGEDAEHGNSQ